MRNLILRGSGSTRLLPAPVVALSCKGWSTSHHCFSLMSYFWIMDPRWATVYHLRAGHPPDYVPALARCSTPERLFWSAHRVGPSSRIASSQPLPYSSRFFRNQFPCWARITRSSSTNALSFSSARTMKRFPSSRCASAIKIVRPGQSTVATHAGSPKPGRKRARRPATEAYTRRKQTPRKTKSP